MTRYTKRPVTINAWQVTAGGGGTEIPDWLREPITTGTIFWSGNFYSIETLEGVMRADIGDWIIKGVKGELYPCKDDIFRQTYEPADEVENTMDLLRRAALEHNVTSGELQVAALKAGASDAGRVAQAVDDFICGRSVSLIVAVALIRIIAEER